MPLCQFALLIALGQQASAVSKRAVPALDEQDLPFYLDKPTPHDSSHFYLFSSLSLISRGRASAVFELSGGPTLGLTPLLGLKIHLPIDESLPTTLFHVTIWGQLNHRFQRELELLALEQEIIALFKELEEINTHYAALFSAQGRSAMQTDRPLTLDKRHYLTDERQKGRAGQFLHTGQKTKATQGLLQLLQLHDNPSQSERLTSQLIGRAGRDGTAAVETITSAAASMRASDAQKASDGTDTIEEGHIIYVFRVARIVVRYLLENKIETMIYLCVLILLSLSLKTIFGRL